MRINTLELRAYGPFSGTNLHFSDTDRSFNMVYGANEAGKSTILRAIIGLLYGVHAKTPDNHLHQNADLRIGARLTCADGEEMTFTRRKGNANTLSAPDGKPIQDAALWQCLGGVDQGMFETLYGLNHETLRRGGQDLCMGKGLLSESLFQAATGLVGIRTKLQELDEEAENMWTPRSRNKPLNEKLKRCEELRKRVIDKTASVSKWAADQKILTTINEELTKLQTSQLEQEKRLRRLQDVQRAMVPVNQLRQLRREEADLAGAVLLSPDASSERERIVAKHNDETENRSRRLREILTLEQALSQLSVPTDLLSEEYKIAQLQDERGSYLKAVVTDLPDLRANANSSEREAVALLHELRPDLSLGSANTIRLTVQQRQKILSLAPEHIRITTQLDSERNVVEESEVDLSTKQAELNGIDIPKDISELQSCADRIRSDGDLESHLRKTNSEIESDKHEVLVAFGRLGRVACNLEGLQSLEVPLAATISYYEGQFDTLLSDLRSCEDRRRSVDDDITLASTDIQELHYAGDVPLEEDLIAARERRDAGWMHVLKAWEDAEERTHIVKEFEEGAALPAAYEASVYNADLISDRLRRESERTAKLAQLIARQDSLSKRRAALDSEISVLSGRQSELQSEWQTLWEPSGLTPRTPREMREWLTQLEQVLGLIKVVIDLMHKPSSWAR